MLMKSNPKAGQPDMGARLRQNAEMLGDGLQGNLSDAWHNVAMKHAANDAIEAADLILSLQSQLEAAESNRDAARANFLTMQQSAAKLLEARDVARAGEQASDEYIVLQRAAIATLQAERDAMREALEEIASPTQTLNLLWWQERARKALEPIPCG